MSESSKHILIFEFYNEIYQDEQPETFYCNLNEFEKNIHNLINLAFKNESEHFSIEIYEAELEENGNIDDALLGDDEQLTGNYPILRDGIFIKIIDFLQKYDASTLWYRIFRDSNRTTIFEFKFVEFNEVELDTFESADDVYYYSAGIFKSSYNEEKLLNQAHKNIGWNRRNISDN